MRDLFPANTFVPPKMPSGKDLVRLVIAEAPGEEEAAVGEPLIGGAGRWFNTMLKAAGIPREGLTIANCIQCRPPKNVFPTAPEAQSYISKEAGNAAVRHCRRAHLEPLLSSRDWKRVDLLGDKPLNLVAGVSGGIFKWRGSPGQIALPSGRRLPYVATLHPAYVMRDQSMFPVAVNDLMKGLIPPPENYTPEPSLEEVRAFSAKKFALDIESNRWTQQILMVGVSAEPTKAMAIPFRGAYIPEIKRILLNADHIIGHNAIQFDLPILFKALDIEW